MKKYIWSILWIFAFTGFVGCTNNALIEMLNTNQHTNKWAIRVGKSKISNFYRVDHKLYRSAQLKEDDFKELYRMGIYRVLNLQQHHHDQDEIGSLPIEEYRVQMSVFAPKYDDLVKAIRYIEQSDTPVLVHCMKGSDRTGTVVAAYRIAIHNWSKEDAVKEMIGGGYGHNTKWVKLHELLNSLDIEKFRRDISDEPTE